MKAMKLKNDRNVYRLKYGWALQMKRPKYTEFFGDKECGSAAKARRYAIDTRKLIEALAVSS